MLDIDFQLKEPSIDSLLLYPCISGDLERVKYLLTSPELTEHSDIKHGYYMAFKAACKFGHLEIVQYMLTSPDLKERADLCDMTLCFKGAYSCEKIAVVEYLLLLRGYMRVNFQMTDYNLDWALSKKHHGVIKAMVISLYVHDMVSYLDYFPRIEQYCLDNGLNFVEWQEAMVKEDVDINYHTTELFV